MQSLDEILDQAKQLPPQQRLLIIRELLQTLESDDEILSDAGWNAVWIPELESRLSALDRGETQADDWTSAITRMRRTLDAGQSP